MALVRFAFALLIGTGAAAMACASDAPRTTAAIGLNILAAKGLLDVDEVKLAVYETATVRCKGATIPVDPAPGTPVFQLVLAKCDGGKKWCGSGELAKDETKVLTWYVEGKKGGGLASFTGCVEKAVDQNPLQVDIKVEPYITGAKCGDAAVIPPETCDPGGGAVDEACDGTKCSTKEVIVSNGLAGQGFYRGRPARKSGLSARFIGDKFFTLWSDTATGIGGGDASADLTIRRLTDNLISETAPLVLKSEVRLPTDSGGATSSGTRRRSGQGRSPQLVAVEGGGMLAVFEYGVAASSKIVMSLQKTNLGPAGTPDVDVAPGGTNQTTPGAAASASGDVLIAWVEANAIKSNLRKSGGALATVQTLSSGGTVSGPRVAWLGGDYIVVWSDGDDIKMRRVGADGMAKGGEAVVNATRKPGKQDQPDVAAVPTGEFLVAWRDASGEVGADIRVQKFDKVGGAVGSEIGQILNNVSKEGDQSNPVVAAGKTPSGQLFYLVAWVNPTTQQIAARFVSGVTDGFFINHVNATRSEFDVGLDARLRSSPAVAIGGPAPGHCAIAWSDDAEGDVGADDDRVRVRRIPLPYTP